MKKILTNVLTVLLVCATSTTIGIAQDSRDTDQPQSPSAELSQEWANLNLTSEQQTQIRDIVKQHNEKLMSTWKEFNQVHGEAIQLEATMYAALEDQMNSSQKQKFREHRHSKHQKDKSARSSADANRSGTSNKTTAQSASYDSSNKKTQTSDSEKDADQETAEVFVATMVIMPVEDAVRRSGLDNDQMNKCSATCRKFHNRLSQAWTKIHKLHNELVRIEADKLDALQDVLTEEQIEKLKEQRSSES